MWSTGVFAHAALALLIERIAGYPKPVHDRIGHPVEWIGAVITWLDTTLNRPTAPAIENRLRGVLALLCVIGVALVPAWMVSEMLAQWSKGWIVEALLATSLIAQKSMKDHVKSVYKALGRSLPEARRAVAHIVGRDSASLDESGIAKATLESLAENTSDGIVAPVFWYALLGLPGIAAYKAINTADSMIGHRSDRYLTFGWAAARLDDIVNLPCSRLTGLLFAAVDHVNFRNSLAIMWRDAPKHQSPNAGWPEAAMAAVLGVKFGGGRSYNGEVIHLPTLGDGRAQLTRDDIRRGLRVYSWALTYLVIGIAALAVIF